MTLNWFIIGGAVCIAIASNMVFDGFRALIFALLMGIGSLLIAEA